MARGEAQTMPCQVDDRSHQPTEVPLWQAERSTPKWQVGTQITDWARDTQSGPFPGETQPKGPDPKPTAASQGQSTFWTERELLLWCTVHRMGCRGRVFWDCTGIPKDCFRKDLKTAKRHSGNSGKSSMGKEDQSHLNTLLVSAFVWPCLEHGPAQPISCLLIKVLSSSPGWETTLTPLRLSHPQQYTFL